MSTLPSTTSSEMKIIYYSVLLLVNSPLSNGNVILKDIVSRDELYGGVLKRWYAYIEKTLIFISFIIWKKYEDLLEINLP